MEAQTVAPVDTSAPTPVAAPAADEPRSALSGLNADERQAWDRDGKLPERLTDWKAPAAEKPAPAAATGDDAPAVDAQNQPILGQDGKPLSKRAADAERRTREAIDRATAGTIARAEAAERRAAELEARLNGQQQQQPPAPVAAAVPPAAVDKPPVLEDFLDQPDPYLALSDALVDYRVNKALTARDKKVEQAEQQTAADRAVLGAVQTYQARENAFKATVPDFDARTLPLRQILDVSRPFDREILASEVAPQLILHLAEHHDITRRIGALAERNLPAALRELGKLEAQFSSAAAAAPAQPAAVTPKTVSDAPAIGTTLGSQPAAAANDAHAAIARKDFRSFDEIETAKDLAKIRRSAR